MARGLRRHSLNWGLPGSGAWPVQIMYHSQQQELSQYCQVLLNVIILCSSIDINPARPRNNIN